MIKRFAQAALLTFLFSIIQVNIVEAHSASPTSSANENKSVDPDKSIDWLKNGNKRFAKAQLRKDGQSTQDIVRLSTGQSPHSIVLSCSDSRVPPEVVFDQKLGELFTVRTAGEALNDNVIGSIEYAVEHLGSRLVLVMGHSNCGAVKAALDTMGDKDAGSPALNGLVKDIQPRLSSFKDKERSKNIEAESWANVEGVAKDLLARSVLLKKHWQSGKIKIQTALYHLETGAVEFSESLDLRAPASTEK